MKRIILSYLFVFFAIITVNAQSTEKVIKGTCGDNAIWSYDGYTLTVSASTLRNELVEIYDYNLQKIAPWIKKKLSIKRVRIGKGIGRIGSCAFANCTELQDVEFESVDLISIGWGAFLNCTNLHNISLPICLEKIETIAFARCGSLSSIQIPEHCRLEDQAFVSCTGLKQLQIGSTCLLGNACFANEVKVGGQYKHEMLDAEIKHLPVYITAANCHEYGLNKECVEKYYENNQSIVDYDEITSDVDFNIPQNRNSRNDTYALIIGNQNYRFVPNVAYAIHDAHVFAEYCKTTLGIPSSNIHMLDDATKSMIKDQEMEWLSSIKNPEDKQLIVYYAGHGVPDVKDQNKAYLLPCDVLGTRPNHGISIDEFYGFLGNLNFNRVNVFLDACFSGITRDNEGVTEGTRAVEIVADDVTINNGNVIVFSAAKGNETAQALTEQGHGLFTYYLLQELQNAEDPSLINFGKFSQNIINNVSKHSPTMKARKNQTPNVNASSKISKWKDTLL